MKGIRLSTPFIRSCSGWATKPVSVFASHCLPLSLPHLVRNVLSLDLNLSENEFVLFTSSKSG